MALVLKDRVRESSTSSGTGSITLAGAFTGYQTFNSAVASGSTVYYTIHNTTSPNDNEWEVGVGTFTAPSTLSRDTVFSSSAGGTTKVNFSGSSTLEVFITQPAEQAVYINDATGKVEVFGNGTNTVSFTDINTATLTANTVTLTAGTISTNAANATDITNKQYVDGLFSTGISYHDPVRVESPTALSPVTYNNGSSGVGATLTNAGTQTALVIDGVTLSLNDRVLIYTQTDQTQNGIYTVTNVGSGSTNWVLTRATDADSYGLADPNALGQGDAVFVQQGNTGAGETYVCNTPGTIVFGTTNITFVQISSAQIYAAGTGLNLSNLTFSIANTAVTAATYGNDGNVAQFTVNAQGQLTNAANVAINASSISVGTLDNARTTASAANGASTIVLRDTNGSFNANVGTFTTVNATSGNFTDVSGNGSALTAINASNISSGTIANARTTANTANSANTIVARDANGSFGANIISASFSGDGSAITGINASNISSGTIDNSRTTAASANGASTIVQRDSGGNFSANTITANISGDISGGTNINASNISSGTIANARTTASSSNGASTIVLRGASGEFAAGAITGSLFTGNGSAISAINASNISTGTIDNARTTAASANGASTIVARDAGGNFAANTITATTFSGGHSGNGASLTDINASNISSGTIANARTTASSSNGASTIVLRGASGEFTAGAITGASFTGNGAAISAINASNISTGTIDNARTSASASNGASTIVSRDAGGNFAAATITATTFSGSHSGNGAALSAINASNISSGTLSAQYGGTGSANLTADNVILGNGASAVKVVAPGTANNVLTSNGTTWISQAPSSGANAATPTARGTVYGLTAVSGESAALGYNTLLSLTTGNGNIAVGYAAGESITSGGQNIAIGGSALRNIVNSNDSIGIGQSALGSVSGNSNSIGIGTNALREASGNNNTAVGYLAGYTGTNNITSGVNNILIGYNAQASSATVSNETTIGNSSTTSARIFGKLSLQNGSFAGISSTIASAATITPTSDATNQYTVTALAADATIAIPSGTPADGQKLTIRIKDNGTARALTWTTSAGGYRIVGTTLPTTTTANKVVYIGCIYNSQDSFWDVVSVAQQA